MDFFFGKAISVRDLKRCFGKSCNPLSQWYKGPLAIVLNEASWWWVGLVLVHLCLLAMAMRLWTNIELQGLHNQRIKLGEHKYVRYLYIFTWAPCCCALLVIINSSINEKKWIDFVKIKFYLNKNIEWYCMY